MVINGGKLILLGIIITGLFVLIAAGRASFGEVTPYLTLILGYLVGNGASALEHRRPSPAFDYQPPDDTGPPGGHPDETPDPSAGEPRRAGRPPVGRRKP